MTLMFLGFFSRFGVPLGLGAPRAVRFGCWEQSCLASRDLEAQVTVRGLCLMQWVDDCPLKGLLYINFKLYCLYYKMTPLAF